MMRKVYKWTGDGKYFSNLLKVNTNENILSILPTFLSSFLVLWFIIFASTYRVYGIIAGMLIAAIYPIKHLLFPISLLIIIVFLTIKTIKENNETNHKLKALFYDDKRSQEILVAFLEKSVAVQILNEVYEIPYYKVLHLKKKRKHTELRFIDGKKLMIPNYRESYINNEDNHIINEIISQEIFMHIKDNKNYANIAHIYDLKFNIIKYLPLVTTTLLLPTEMFYNRETNLLYIIFTIFMFLISFLLQNIYIKKWERITKGQLIKTDYKKPISIFINKHQGMLSLICGILGYLMLILTEKQFILADLGYRLFMILPIISFIFGVRKLKEKVSIEAILGIIISSFLFFIHFSMLLLALINVVGKVS